MYCTRCGFQNEPGTAFCTKCGAPAEQAAPPSGPPPAVPPGYVPQGHAPQPGYPPAAAYVPPKKKRTGLIIGLIAGGVGLIGVVAAVLLFFLSGPAISGIWSCQDRGWVLEIGDGVVTEYSPAGTDTVRYSFDGSNGTTKLQDGSVSFTVKGNSLRLTDETTGDKYLFIRQGADFDIKAALLKSLEGMWSSEALGEVIEFHKEGRLRVYAANGDLDGGYDFDIRKGQGSFTVNGKAFEFTAGWNTLSVDTVGDYVRAEKGLDAAAFVSRFANPLPGTWYETTGTYGTITFAADGTFALAVYGKTFAGTYTFEPGTGSGSVLLKETGETESFTYANGTVTLDGMTYTQNYVEQPGAEEINAAVEGAWYDDELPEEMVIFYGDGTLDVTGADTFYSGTYTFDPFEQNGVITLTDGTRSESYEFYLKDGMLYLNGYTYTRETPNAGSILGTWYDTAGMQGTLYFDKDGLAIMDSYGTMFYGTYMFDETAGAGSMTLNFVDGPYTWSLYIWDGLLYNGDTVYTKNYVKQTSDTNAG